MTGTGSSLERAITDRCAALDGGIIGASVGADQLDLLADDKGALPANVYRILRQQQRGVGRPAGAGNKRNKKIAELICQRSGHPVLFMSDIYAMPLDQLVQLLRIANGDLEREERLGEVFDRVLEIAGDVARVQYEQGSKVEKLTELVEELAELAKASMSKPGAVAIQALALQLQAARATAEYVEGKQPVSVHVQGKADLVMVIPGLNAPADAAGEVAQLIEKHGIDAIDFDNMKLVEPIDDDGAQEDDE